MTKAEIKKLDDLRSEIVKLLANNKCSYDGCYKTKYLNSHHIFSRHNRLVRRDLDNGICLCSGHHTLCNNSAHKAPADFIEWIKIKRGKKRYDNLRLKANKPAENQDFETIYNYLKSIKVKLKLKKDL